MSLILSTALRNHIIGLITNLVANGTFATNTASWMASNATLSVEAGGQVTNALRITETGGLAAGKAYQDITTKVGHAYRLTVYFKKGTADGGKIYVGTTGDENAIYESGALTDAAWAQKVVMFIATATTTRITLESTDAMIGKYSDFDEVVVDCIDSGLVEVFKDCFLNIYTGAQPASADAAPTGTKLVTIYSDGAAAGLEFDEAVAGVMAKKATETWSGPGLANGTAGWFRLYLPGDAEGLSTTEIRLDGACGISGAQLNMSSLSITQGAVQTINTFSLTQPQS